MNKITLALICTLFMNIAFPQDQKVFSENELIICFKEEFKINFENYLKNQKFENSILDSLNEHFFVNKIILTGNKKKRKTYILKFRTNQDIKQLIEIYSKTGLFEYIEPNFMGKSAGQPGNLETIPNDTYFSRQYGLYNDGTFTLSPAIEDADIDMELAWDIEEGDTSIVVAILDTGVKPDHPELNGRI